MIQSIDDGDSIDGGNSIRHRMHELKLLGAMIGRVSLKFIEKYPNLASVIHTAVSVRVGGIVYRQISPFLTNFFGITTGVITAIATRTLIVQGLHRLISLNDDFEPPEQSYLERREAVLKEFTESPMIDSAAQLVGELMSEEPSLTGL